MQIDFLSMICDIIVENSYVGIATVKNARIYV